MSEPLRIAIVAEGFTDKIVVAAAISALVGDRPYLLRLLQPEESLPLEPATPFTGKGRGWGGVYLWCREARARSGGRLRDDPLFMEYDILILHLDADVAGKRYSDCEINDVAGDLPCERPCPPPSATTDNLRQVLLRWIGENQLPPKTVLCTPSKSCESWVVAALFPNDPEMLRKGWECHPAPDTRLNVQPIAVRIAKSEKDYKRMQPQMSAEWQRIRAELSEAGRFSSDFLSVLPPR